MIQSTPFRCLRLAAALLSVVCAFSAPLAARSAEPDASKVIRIGTTANDGGMPVYYAQELGLFKKAGINVEITAIANGAVISTGIITGAYDFGILATTSVASAHERGLPLVMVAPGSEYVSSRPNNQLLVMKSSPIRSAGDLDGKVVAVAALLNSGHVATMAWIDKHGGKSANVKFIEMPYPVMLPALKAGRIDAASISEPFMHAALPETRSLGAPYDAVASEFMLGGLFTRLDYAKANPETVRKVSDIVTAAGAWANTHPEESALLVEKYLKTTVPPGTIRFLFATKLNAALLQPLIDVSAKYKALKVATPAAELIYTPPAQ